MRLEYRNIHIGALCWISISVLIFLVAWCHWYISLPITGIVCFLHWRFYQSLSNKETLVITIKQLIIATLLVLLMMLLSGIGGYVVQSNDHYYRNSWFIDIINYDWPVYNAEEHLYMCYYFTFWLVPALVGKVFHSIDIGFFFQLIWISIGSLLLFLEMCIYIGKVKIGSLFIFYFFAGIKIVECILYFPLFGGDTIRNTILTLATNGSPGVFHAGPIVQLLYDPFNQTIPLFLVMMLILNNRKSPFLALIYSFVLYYAPFPFIGLTPIVLYLFIKNTDWSNMSTWMKSWFTIQNVLALILILIVGFFYLANINASHQGFRPTSNIEADIYSFVLYLLFEFVIFIAIGYHICEDKKLLWIAFLSVCVLGWFQVGEHNDFCFRTNMPLIFMLCLLLIKRFYDSQTSKMFKNFIVVCLLLGGIPAQIHPLLRCVSTGLIIAEKDQSILNQYQSFYDVKNMYVMQQDKIRNDDFGSIFGKSSDFDWTVNSLKASPDSFFFKYIAKK